MEYVDLDGSISPPDRGDERPWPGLLDAPGDRSQELPLVSAELPGAPPEPGFEPPWPEEPAPAPAMPGEEPPWPVGTPDSREEPSPENSEESLRPPLDR